MYPPCKRLPHQLSLHLSQLANKNLFVALEVTHSAPFHTSNQQHKPGNITHCQTSHVSGFSQFFFSPLKEEDNTKSSSAPPPPIWDSKTCVLLLKVTQTHFHSVEIKGIQLNGCAGREAAAVNLLCTSFPLAEWPISPLLSVRVRMIWIDAVLKL